MGENVKKLERDKIIGVLLHSLDAELTELADILNNLSSDLKPVFISPEITAHKSGNIYVTWTLTMPNETMTTDNVHVIRGKLLDFINKY